MPISNLPDKNKKPKNVQEGLGIDITGGVVVPPRAPEMIAGGAMGSLSEMAMERKKMNGELGGPTQMSQQEFFSNKKRKRTNNGLTDETSGFGQS